MDRDSRAGHHRERLILQRGRESIVPTIEEAEQGDHREDLNDLTFVEVRPQRREPLVCARVGDAAGGERGVQGGALRSVRLR